MSRRPVHAARPATPACKAPASPMAVAVVVSALVALALVATPAAAQTTYLAFGDSITAGSFDDREPPGYPPRLEELLTERGLDAVVENHGVPGETTGEALSRIDGVLAGGGDVLLLMEGTNDVNARVSEETIRFNLAEIASRATDAGVETVHATVVPRLPSANFDGSNRVTGRLAGSIRDLAWERGRSLADPFEVFFRQTPDVFDRFYNGGDDKLHPNPAGYDLLAEVFADVLTAMDTVPPVTGVVSPFDDQQNVSPSTEVVVDLYDFGAGIDVGATRLLIDDEPVDARITGDGRRQQIRYTPPEPFSGVVFVGLEAQDLEVPANRRSGTLVQFVVEGTDFLPGDISRDGRVDGEDLVALALAFGTQRGDSRFRGFADLDGDDDVDGDDLAILASNFGQRGFGG